MGITQLPKYPDGDRGYMHRRFGTLGHEAQVRNVFYFLSALCSATGFWWLIQEFKILRPSPKDREIIQELKKSF
ncbi:MAG: hypothetical protein LBI53_00425 [Candidatus Peribacteria bacterium]|nr:hypothetical protein [Candidatus Peribacteria bacterium]